MRLMCEVHEDNCLVVRMCTGLYLGAVAGLYLTELRLKLANPSDIIDEITRLFRFDPHKFVDSKTRLQCRTFPDRAGSKP